MYSRTPLQGSYAREMYLCSVERERERLYMYRSLPRTSSSSVRPCTVNIMSYCYFDNLTHPLPVY